MRRAFFALYPQTLSYFCSMTKAFWILLFVTLSFSSCEKSYNCVCLFEDPNSEKPREEYASFEARPIDAESTCYASIEDTTGLIECELVE